MDAGKGQWIVAIFAFVAGFTLVASASPVRIYSGDFYLRIPADPNNTNTTKGLMADAIIEIPDHFPIADLDVVVKLKHEAFFDLEIILQSPAGTNVILNLSGNLAFIIRGADGGLTSAGGSAEWLFNDEAAVSIQQATEPYNGPYRPLDSLSVLDGESTSGQWRLRIYDAWPAGTGFLEHFELMIEIPEPATAILLTLGAALTTLLNRPKPKV